MADDVNRCCSLIHQGQQTWILSVLQDLCSDDNNKTRQDTTVEIKSDKHGVNQMTKV